MNIEQLKDFLTYCYERDDKWYCNGVQLDNPIVIVQHIDADPYTDIRIITCLIITRDFLGTGTTY